MNSMNSWTTTRGRSCGPCSRRPSPTKDGPEDLHSLIMETKTGKNGPCVLLEDAVKALCGRTLAEVIEEIQDGAGSEVTLAGPDSWDKSP